MNQGGWGLKEFMFILGVIVFALIITAGIYRKNFQELFGTKPEPVVEKTTVVEKETYTDLEYKLLRAGERYQNDKYQGKYDSVETWYLSYRLLREENYLKDKLTDINDRSIECSGYVRFEKDGTKIDYSPYLKCGSSYQTKGYDEKYDA